MKVEIVSKEKNPTLSRQEIKFEVKDSNITPSRKELREKISALTNSKLETIVVDRLNQKFGTSSVKGVARIYDSEEKLKRVETKFLLKRNFGEEKKEEAKPKEGTEKPEAPAKEKKKGEQ